MGGKHPVVDSAKQRAQFEIDAAMMGVTVDELIAATQPAATEVAEQQDFLVWQDNLIALGVFVACSSQWRILTGGTKPYYQGLRYEALEAVLRLRNIKDRAAVFGDVQVMEAAAREVLNAA